MRYQALEIKVPGQNYPVYVGAALFRNKELLEPHIKGHQVMVVTQQNIADLYLKDLLAALSAYAVDVCLLPQGEQHKNLRSWRLIMDQLLEKQHQRSTTIIALGGGVVGDVAGFAAACYQRGVNYIQVPTTLIAQVDSAVGGKTGVNHAAGKNLIGAFYHPACVIADTQTLSTLPRREYIAGLAEVIKCGLIRDAAFFNWLEAQMPGLMQGQPELLSQAIYTALRIKGEIVAADEREQSGLRSLLNFGHTLGHALEALYRYRRYLHGEAVAIGMNFAAQLSLQKAGLGEKDYQRIQALLKASDLPVDLGRHVNEEQLLPYLMRDKKVSAGGMKWVLLKGIGEAVLTDQVTREDLGKLISRPKN